MSNKIGIGMIILAFVLAVLGDITLLIAIPIFLIGAVLVWCGKKPITHRILWTVLPVLLWYPGFVLSMFVSETIANAKAQKIDFIFPADFSGNAIVIGGMPCGQPVRVEQGREQLIVPENGIVLYQGNVKLGAVDHRYFYAYSPDSLATFPSRSHAMFFSTEKNQPSRHEKGVWVRGTGTRTSYEFKPELKYDYMSLWVGAKDSIELRYYTEEKPFWDAADTLVKNCAAEHDPNP